MSQDFTGDERFVKEFLRIICLIHFKGRNF